MIPPDPLRRGKCARFGPHESPKNSRKAEPSRACSSGSPAASAWLGVGLATDLELVEAIVSGRALETRAGEYLHSLKERFSGEVMADMLCLLRIQAEQAVRAKGLLLAREAVLEAPVGDDVRATLGELRYLEKSVGRTGLLALRPVLRQGTRDLWQVYFLEEAGGSGGRPPAPRTRIVSRPGSRRGSRRPGRASSGR
jgi:hypothetical protein